MSEQELTTGTIAEACSRRGNLTMTRTLLKLACYTEPPTCTVQTHGVNRQSIQNKLASVSFPKKSSTLTQQKQKKRENSRWRRQQIQHRSQSKQRKNGKGNWVRICESAQANIDLKKAIITKKKKKQRKDNQQHKRRTKMRQKNKNKRWRSKRGEMDE